MSPNLPTQLRLAADEAAYLSDDLTAELWARMTVEPVARLDLAEGAGDALGGYALVLGGAHGDGVHWEMDLTDRPEIAERVAYGLIERGQRFERTGEDYNVIIGEGELPEIRDGDDPLLALAAIVEITGTPEGRLFGGDQPRAAQVQALANAAGFNSELVYEDDGDAGEDVALLVDLQDRIAVATLPVFCADALPVVGGRGCRFGADDVADGAGPEAVGELDPIEAADWIVATTGPIGVDAEAPLSADDGGVKWGNLEAQRYLPSSVTSSDSGFLLKATLGALPSIKVPPYTSGMVISEQRFGYGRFDVEVVLPVGEGLWPAVWLLANEACVSPGVCDGYESVDYLEIDLIETRGQDPTTAHASVHWFDERLMSSSEEVLVPDLGDGEPHTVSLERRPGLLQWFIDGRLIATVAGQADAAVGPHKESEMMMVVNLAVGGTFAGGDQLGRGSEWIGDARAPVGFPNLDWNEATLELRGFTYTEPQVGRAAG